jgi:hypothetical protein
VWARGAGGPYFAPHGKQRIVKTISPHLMDEVVRGAEGGGPQGIYTDSPSHHGRAFSPLYIYLTVREREKERKTIYYRG